MRFAIDKWSAFYLSAIIPGAGQAAARSWSALFWLAGGLLLSGCVWLARSAQAPAATAISLTIGGGLFAFACAEHAKRLVEVRRTGAKACLWRRTVSRINRGRRIDVRMELLLAGKPEAWWPVIADLPRFLTIDPFHDRVTLMKLPAAAGVDLVLSHNAFGHRFLRFGKILKWAPGAGYTFSDLSGRSPQQGFPHVFVVAIEEAHDDRGSDLSGRTLLTIHVRGRWTSPMVPAIVGRWWVTWVCREHARLLAKAL